MHTTHIYRSAAKIRPPFLGISASGKIGVGVISRKHNFLENRPTLQTDLENMLVFSSEEKKQNLQNYKIRGHRHLSEVR